MSKRKKPVSTDSAPSSLGMAGTFDTVTDAEKSSQSSVETESSTSSAPEPPFQEPVEPPAPQAPSVDERISQLELALQKLFQELPKTLADRDKRTEDMIRDYVAREVSKPPQELATQAQRGGGGFDIMSLLSRFMPNAGGGGAEMVELQALNEELRKQSIKFMINQYRKALNLTGSDHMVVTHKD